ncbi:MAG: hypothetical protein KKF26_00885 [Chloroflexi bacterium]|nr:hypothetical protein [Chloroflexota bacterium]
MFWKKTKGEEPSQPKAEHLPGPRSIEELVGRQLVIDLKQNPDQVWKLRSVVRQRTEGKHRFDFRVFDGNQVAASKIKVKDYTSLDNQPELVLYEGWFDKVSMAVHFEKK